MKGKGYAMNRLRPRGSMLAALILVAMAGCAGPQAPLLVGIKEVPSDVVLTRKRPQAATAPIPPIGLPIREPAISAFEHPIFEAVVGPCPSADPLAAPSKEAVNTILLPPAAGTYSFRNEGSFEVSGANAKKGAFPSLSTRTVKEVFKVMTPGSTETWYRFDVEAVLADFYTTTTYTLVPEQAGPTVVTGPQPGLFITRVQTQLPNGTSEDFRPANFPGLLLLPFPFSPGVEWNAAGADPRSGTAMAFTGLVGQKVRIDACGTPLDAVTVQVDGQFGETEGPGTAISPLSQTRFAAEYALGTQFGGLSLMDLVEMTRTDPRGNLYQKNRSTINSEPGLPKSDVRICATGCFS